MFLRRLILVTLALSAFSCASHRAETFYFGDYSEAEQLFNKGDYEKAIQKYQAYIDENPEGNLALISQYYMAKSYAALGKKTEAKSLFEKIVREHKDEVWADFSAAQLKELDKAASAQAAEAPASSKPA